MTRHRSGPGHRPPGRRLLPEGLRWSGTGPALGLGVVGQLAGVALVATSAWLIARASLRPPILTLSVAIAAVRLFALARGSARYGERLATHASALRLLGRLRLWTFTRLEPLVPGALSARRGDVLARLVADVEGAGDLTVRVAFPLATVAISTVPAVVLAALLDPGAGAVVSAGAVATVVGSLWLHRVFGPDRHREPVELRGRRDAVVLETVQAAPDLVAFGYAARATGEVALANSRLNRATSAAGRSTDVAQALVVAMAGLTTAATLAASAPLAREGAASLPTVAVLALLALTTVDGLAVLPEALAVGTRSVAALRRVTGLVGGEPGPGAPGTAPQLASAARLATPAPAPVRPPGRVRPTRARAPAALELDRVTVVRDPARGPVLRDLALHVAPGECVGLVGPSGAGKTTVAELLLGFLRPTSGLVRVLGTDPATASAAGAGPPVAWSPQEPPVFATSVRANLVLARPDAGDGQIAELLREVGLGEWLDGLPEGLGTGLGERGTTVSGGERQRIGVARALLADRPVLVLDEPTAHLDAASAARVGRAVAERIGRRSCLWITHEAADRSHFDRVLELGPPAS